MIKLSTGLLFLHFKLTADWWCFCFLLYMQQDFTSGICIQKKAQTIKVSAECHHSKQLLDSCCFFVTEHTTELQNIPIFVWLSCECVSSDSGADVRDLGRTSFLLSISSFLFVEICLQSCILSFTKQSHTVQFCYPTVIKYWDLVFSFELQLICCLSS